MNKDRIDEFTCNLIELRKNFNLNQQEIAKYLGIDQTTVSKIETRERQYTLSQVEKLCELYGISLNTLFEKNGWKEQVTFALRSKTLQVEDLNAIARINRIALNIIDMKNWLRTYEDRN